MVIWGTVNKYSPWQASHSRVMLEVKYYARFFYSNRQKVNTSTFDMNPHTALSSLCLLVFPFLPKSFQSILLEPESMIIQIPGHIHEPFMQHESEFMLLLKLLISPTKFVFTRKDIRLTSPSSPKQL